jgi:hypothetical protein
MLSVLIILAMFRAQVATGPAPNPWPRDAYIMALTAGVP